MNKLVKNKKVISTIISILIVILFIAMVIPFFITTKYALFVTDDFPIANTTVANFDGSYFRTGIKCAANYWRVYNGNWFSFAVAYGLHPIVHGGQKALVLALRIQLLLAITGAVYFCFSLASFFNFRKEKALRIMALVLLPALSFKEYFDLYLWWLTSCTYFMPLYCFLFGFGTYLFALKSGKIWQYAISGLFLLAMAGGSLNVVGMGCYTLLFSLVAWCLYNKKFCLPGTIVFVITLIGACLNAFSPGSFARQSTQETEKVGIIKALFIELQIMGVEGKWLVLHTAFIAVVLIALFWGSRLKRHVALLHVIIATIFCVTLPVVTMFPVVLGYGNIDYKDISNRGYCLMDITIIFASCFMAVLWGIYLKDVISGQTKKITTVILAILVIANIVLCGQKFGELVPVQIATNLNNGYNEQFFDTWMEIYAYCENGAGEDVEIEMPVPSRKAGCSWAKLADDPEKWWNTTISEYYGLNSISLKNTLDE